MIIITWEHLIMINLMDKVKFKLIKILIMLEILRMVLYMDLVLYFKILYIDFMVNGNWINLLKNTK